MAINSTQPIILTNLILSLSSPSTFMTCVSIVRSERLSCVRRLKQRARVHGKMHTADFTIRGCISNLNRRSDPLKKWIEPGLQPPFYGEVENVRRLKFESKPPPKVHPMTRSTSEAARTHRGGWCRLRRCAHLRRYTGGSRASSRQPLSSTDSKRGD